MGLLLDTNTDDLAMLHGENHGINPGVLACWVWVPEFVDGARIFGSGSAIYVNALGTAGEVTVGIRHATTDTTYTSSDAGLAANKWLYLAYYEHADSANDDPQICFWVGDSENPPRRVTLTETVAGTGNPNETGNFLFGTNSSSGTTGTIGFILGHAFAVSATRLVTAESPFAVNAGNVLEENTLQLVEQLVVHPFWRGETLHPALYRLWGKIASANRNITVISLMNGEQRLDTGQDANMGRAGGASPWATSTGTGFTSTIDVARAPRGYPSRFPQFNVRR